MIKGLRTVLLRDEKALIKETILNEVWERYDTANKNGQFNSIYTKNEGELKEKATGNVLLYTKGFRASSNSKTAGLKGASQISIAILEEAEDFRDPLKYNTFVDSLRKEGCLIVILMNTTDIGHHLQKRYFDYEHVLDDKGEPTGYFKLIPKKNVPGFVAIQTNYLNNPYLPSHIVYNYNAYGDPKSPTYDYHYYMTSIMGYASSGRKGQIFTKVKRISREEYNSLPYKPVYGQDFGTASPAAFGATKFYQNNAYMDCLNYKPKTILDLAKMYCLLEINHNTDKIVCDYAEPDSIQQLSSGFKNQPVEDYQKYKGLAQGWFVVPCPSKDIEAGISLMNSMNLYLVDDCAEAWEEVYNYVYAQDKYGNYTNTPIDNYNHFLDQARYVIVSERGNKGISFS